MKPKNDTPLLSDHERRVVDIPLVKDEVMKLTGHVLERNLNGHPMMSETEASQLAPYTYEISDLLVKKIIQQEPDCMSKVQLIVHLLEQQQKGDLSFSEIDKTFGLAMAQLYFPESAKEDLQSSEKARMTLTSELDQSTE